MLFRLLTLTDEVGTCYINLEYDPDTLSINKVVYDGHKLTIQPKDGIVLDENLFTIVGKELHILPNVFFMEEVDDNLEGFILQPPNILLYDLLSKMDMIWQ